MSLTKVHRSWLCLLFLAFLLALVMASCNKQQQPAETKAPAGPETFATPDDAAKALVDAAKADNRDAMLAIFGPGSKDVIYSGDAAADKDSFARFASDYDAMHRWRKLENGSELLVTGTYNKVFPIPLKKNEAGKWYFDTEAGKQELLSRRIGRNELAAIDVLATVATAQFEYFAQRHDSVQQFAQKFISDEGKENGLYWPPVQGQPRSPLGPLVAFATVEGYKLKPDSHVPFHGYYFQMLDRQGPDAKGGPKNYIVNGKMTGGFGVLAYPAQYGDSGLMTFMINQNGKIFERDLGTATHDAPGTVVAFNPGEGWRAAELR